MHRNEAQLAGEYRACILAARHAGQVDVGEGIALDELHRRLVAQHLLDHAGNALRVLAQPLQLGRMAQQGQHAVGDQIDGRLVAGDELAHAASGVVANGEPRAQVDRGMRPALGDEPAQCHVAVDCHAAV